MGRTSRHQPRIPAWTSSPPAPQRTGLTWRASGLLPRRSSGPAALSMPNAHPSRYRRTRGEASQAIPRAGQSAYERPVGGSPATVDAGAAGLGVRRANLLPEGMERHYRKGVRCMSATSGLEMLDRAFGTTSPVAT